ncbi:hypothetical protein BJY01DRAFT_206865 [Aspergillus pseudoustus]|uniref:Signal transduction histidine kinase subgroup 3 dimerisation and phosphoacceptor domain-containing protein n=1 Tax=Aspergillus pseudoustus TaxID=1810923 RepID=A0ABR4KM39_9EURO
MAQAVLDYIQRGSVVRRRSTVLGLAGTRAYRPACGNRQSAVHLRCYHVQVLERLQVLTAAPTHHVARVQECDGASRLSSTYPPVLNQILAGDLMRRERDYMISEFHDIVGSLVMLAEPLSITHLARLLCISRVRVEACLGHLHAALSIPGHDAPLRLLHAPPSATFCSTNPCRRGPPLPFKVLQCMTIYCSSVLIACPGRVQLDFPKTCPAATL